MKPNYIGRYYVSKDGDVYSIFSRHGIRKKPIKIKQSTSNGGYKRFCAQLNGNRKMISTHRAVAIVYIKKIKGKEVVGHKDGKKTNNNYRNLKWITPKENSNDQIIHGTTLKGELNVNAKLTSKKVIEILLLKQRGMSQVVASMYGVSQITIRRIWSREAWRHLCV